MSDQAPVTEESLFAQRVHFFHGFTKFVVWNVVLIAVVLILMLIFLVG